MVRSRIKSHSVGTPVEPVRGPAYRSAARGARPWPLLLTIALWLVRVAYGNAATRPNFVFILADDLGYGDLGCFGQPREPTGQ
jgi:hypothetical protein